MHIPVENVTVPPPFLGLHGQSLIDMSTLMSVKDIWLVLWWVGILKEVPTNPWGAP